MENLIKQAEGVQAFFSNTNLSDPNSIETIAKFEELKEIYKMAKRGYIRVKRIVHNVNILAKERVAKLQQFSAILENPTLLEDYEVKLLSAPVSVIISKRPITPYEDVKVQTLLVNSEHMIPDSPIHFITSTKEFAIRIAGTLFKGRGLMYVMQKHQKLTQRQVIDLKRDEIPLSSQQNWVYTSQPLAPENANMRHIGGNPYTLKVELDLYSEHEREMRMNQFIHDLLVNTSLMSSHSRRLRLLRSPTASPSS